jgi:hypothetical protein
VGHHRGTHLGVVLQREVVDGVGVLGSRVGVLREGFGALFCSHVRDSGGRDVLVEDGEEDPHVFEAGVHALAVEGDHGVRGVADDDGRVGEVVRSAFYGYQGEMGVLRE